MGFFLGRCLQGWKRKLFRTGGVSRVRTQKAQLWASVSWSRTFVFQCTLNFEHLFKNFLFKKKKQNPT